jgi:pimeloyl-ACP methyl ester carboxylesterase
MTLTPSESLQHLRLAVELSGVEASEVVLPDSRHVVVQGTRLHYLDWGRRGRPPILFLHGGALSARTWDVVCLGLRADYHCVALVYAADHPQRVDRLVLIDVGPEIRMAGAQRIGAFVANTAEVDSIDAFVEQAMAFNPLRDRRLLTWSVRNNVRQLPNGKWVRKNDARFLGQGGIEEVARRIEAHWQRAAAIVCPTLVVRGALSDVLLDDAAERFARRLPRGQWTRVEGAGHTVQGDNPAGLIAALRPFLADAHD